MLRVQTLRIAAAVCDDIVDAVGVRAGGSKQRNMRRLTLDGVAALVLHTDLHVLVVLTLVENDALSGGTRPVHDPAARCRNLFSGMFVSKLQYDITNRKNLLVEQRLEKTPSITHTIRSVILLQCGDVPWSRTRTVLTLARCATGSNVWITTVFRGRSLFRRRLFTKLVFDEKIAKIKNQTIV